jgi:hypothetical protein
MFSGNIRGFPICYPKQQKQQKMGVLRLLELKNCFDAMEAFYTT